MKKSLSWLSGAFGVVMFLVAIGVLRHELHGRSWADVLAATSTVSPFNLLLAFVLMVLCHLLFTGYDLLAVHALESRPKRASIMLNSFICHAMSMNVGCSSLMGGSIRCHYYLRKGVKPTDVVRIVTFTLVTFWLGFLALGGLLFFFTALPVPDYFPLPIATLRPVGVIFLLTLGAYLFVILVRRRPFVIRGWNIPVLSGRITFAQILVSASEWILGAGVLFVLLPAHPEFTYVHLLAIYFLAQISGLASQVPSGLGVFESILLALAPPDLDPSRVLGSLLLYRLIFHLVPLAAAGFLLLAREVRYRRMNQES